MELDTLIRAVARIPRVWAEIDVRAWEDNFRAIAEYASPARVLAVVKANAYGLGAVEAVRAFRRAGAGHFAVASVSEGCELTDAGLPGDRVMLLGAPLPEEIPELVARGLTATVTDYEIAARISAAAEAQGRIAGVHVLLDTGMGRLGLLPDRAVEEVRRIHGLPGIRVEGLFSHFPAAALRDEPTRAQIHAFETILEALRRAGLDMPWRHIANSVALAGLPETHRPPFNMVRPGLDLHGAHLSIVPRPYPTRPVFTVKSRIVGIRRLPYGSTVGYGRTYTVTAPEGERIGAVAIGYADGYPRSLSNAGAMLVRGKRCPIVGMVCMDYTMVSLENVPEAQSGDEVVVIGRQDAEEIPIGEVAQAARTIPYELLCHLGARIKRRYLNAAE